MKKQTYKSREEQPGLFADKQLMRDGKRPFEGQRVYTYDYIGGYVVKVSGTLHINVDYPHISDWYIKYDDGHECAVLDLALIFEEC